MSHFDLAGGGEDRSNARSLAARISSFDAAMA